MEEIPNCNYYGSLEGPLLGENASIFAVDVAFNGLLERYEKRLEENQAKMITNLRASFAKNLKEFRDSVKGIYLTITNNEKKHAGIIDELNFKIKELKLKRTKKDSV